MDEELLEWLGADENNKNRKAWNGFYNQEFNEKCLAKLKALIQSKPVAKVSREWIMEQYNEQFDMNVIWSGAIDFVIHILKKLGLEVEDA